MKYNLVYFDDRIQNIELYETMLKSHFSISGFTNPLLFSDVLKKNRPHGIMLDLHMPTMDGLTLYENIVDCEHYNGCPIFFISGDASDESRLKTIKKGGIDFFNRQITEEELVLRLMSKTKIFSKGASVLEVGNLKLDTNVFIASINGRPLDFTLIEMRILSCILRESPSTVDALELMEKIWGPNQKMGKIHVHLTNIKAKLLDWTHAIKVKNQIISIDLA